MNKWSTNREGGVQNFGKLVYSKALRYTALRYTDFADIRFLIGSRNIHATRILPIFFTDTRFFRICQEKKENIDDKDDN